MAYTSNERNVSFVASTDLSAFQYRIVDILADNKIGHALAGRGFGILLNAPKANEHGTVQIEGQGKVRAGAAVAVGDYITSAASGWAVEAVAGAAVSSAVTDFRYVVLGRALTAAASGSLFTIQLDRQVTAVASA
jgi:hypothetical protein